MKNIIRKTLAMSCILALILVSGTSVLATEDVHHGDGPYNVTIYNKSTTGISIEGDTFHAFQIFSADNVTSFSVTEDFRNFFSGTSMVAGDGTNTTYDFDQHLNTITAYEDAYGNDDSTASNDKKGDYETALDSYNHLAGQYMDSYEDNMYELAQQIRGYLDQYGAYVDGPVDCTAHATAVKNATTEDESAVLEGLDTGYYFIFDQSSTLNGIGIAASGAFIPIIDTDEYNLTVEVKDSIPVMTKSIYHDDTEKWDIVGDHQIGDTVNFRIISTLPSNIDSYIKTTENPNGLDAYTYTLTDVMSAGLTYDSNMKIFTDSDANNEIPDTYYTIDPSDDRGFTVTVDVIDLMTDYPTVATLYTYYTATLNEDAVVGSAYDDNTATLVYSNNPGDASHTGSTESTVFHHTLALHVNKVDESGAGLAGATFSLLDVDGYAIPLSKGEADKTTGVVPYYYDKNATALSDGAYIITEAVELTDGTTVTGKFQIYGLNDQTFYTLKEVSAPTGYTLADQFDIFFTVEYNDLGTEITYLADGSTYVYTSQSTNGDWHSTSEIINRLKIYLPHTGGTGTMIFQIGGAAVMLGAAAMLVVSKRKKEEN